MDVDEDIVDLIRDELSRQDLDVEHFGTLPYGILTIDSISVCELTFFVTPSTSECELKDCITKAFESLILEAKQKGKILAFDDLADCYKRNMFYNDLIVPYCRVAIHGPGVENCEYTVRAAIFYRIKKEEFGA